MVLRPFIDFIKIKMCGVCSTALNLPYEIAWSAHVQRD